MIQASLLLRQVSQSQCAEPAEPRKKRVWDFLLVKTVFKDNLKLLARIFWQSVGDEVVDLRSSVKEESNVVVQLERSFFLSPEKKGEFCHVFGIISKH
ncbi:hypothetical protein quinque_005999 [Culex quinquefasciatus]